MKKFFMVPLMVLMFSTMLSGMVFAQGRTPLESKNLASARDLQALLFGADAQAAGLESIDAGLIYIQVRAMAIAEGVDPLAILEADDMVAEAENNHNAGQNWLNTGIWQHQQGGDDEDDGDADWPTDQAAAQVHYEDAIDHYGETDSEGACGDFNNAIDAFNTAKDKKDAASAFLMYLIMGGIGGPGGGF